MRAPLSWLRDFAPFGDDVDLLARSLSSLGLVVEAVERVGEGLDDVIVARVLGTRPHPGADRVQLVEVDAGDPAPTQIVCGAFNFGPGDMVPLAPAGATLPGGFHIGRRKVRGEWSEGMLCSSSELGLAGDADGILLLGPVAGLAPGAPLVEALGFGADVVFDLEVTPNRPDAMSMVGVARDLAARLRLPFSRQVGGAADPPDEATGNAAPGSRVTVEAGDLCPLFASTVLDDVVVGPSPAWMARRLVLAGMRSISNLVDISNYVMIETGNPNHAYDLARLGGGGLIVRRGRVGEALRTLDGTDRTLGPDDCVICDRDNEPAGLAGVMGGASSEIDVATTRVLLEVAWFNPLSVARSANRLGLRTEASVRFERGVDPDALVWASERFVNLATALAGARVSGPTSLAGPGRPSSVPVTLRSDRVNQVLGIEMPAEEVAGHLQAIGFGLRIPFASETGSGAAVTWSVVVPSWRPDCTREIDLIEEVARHHGYDRIPRTRPVIRQSGALTAEQRQDRLVRQVMVGAGLCEAWTSSFCSREALERAGLGAAAAIEVANPLSSDEGWLRPSLLPGLLDALGTNAGHRNAGAALFEVGRVFLAGMDARPAEARPADSAAQTTVSHREPNHLAVILGRADAPAAVEIWHRLAGALRLAVSAMAAVDTVPGLHPGRSAQVVGPAGCLAVVGEVHPQVAAAWDLEGRIGWLEVDLDVLAAWDRRPDTWTPVSRFPSADIDLAFEVDESVPAASVTATLRAVLGEVVEDLELFDVYRGAQVAPSTRSLAWRLRLCSLDHTLADSEITEIRQRAIDAVTDNHPARLRS
ncbi:MAG: phenylalanine--tRNA ligase subunit beta [Acidimicrobiales bacterium]